MTNERERNKAGSINAQMLVALQDAFSIVESEYPKEDERYQYAMRWKKIIDEAKSLRPTEG